MILHQKVKAAKQLEIMHIFTVCPFGNLHFTDFEASLIWMEESASEKRLKYFDKKSKLGVKCCWLGLD